MTDIKTISGTTFMKELSERERLHDEIMEIYNTMNQFGTHTDVMECLKVAKNFPNKAYGVKYSERKEALEDPFSILKFLSKTPVGADRYIRERSMFEVRHLHEILKDFATDRNSAYMTIRKFLQKRRV